MHRIMALVLLMMLSINTWAAPNDFEYFVNGVNRIQQVLGTTPTPSRVQLIEVSTTACNLLKQLNEDSRFISGLQKAAHPSAETRKSLEAMARNEELFTQSFLPVEERVLLDAGLDKAMVSHLMEVLHKFRQGMAQPVDPEKIQARFAQMRSEFCATAVELQNIEDAQLEAARAAALARKTLWRTRGVAMVVADVGLSIDSIVAGTVAAPGPGTAAGAAVAAVVLTGSTALGAMVITFGD